VKIPALLIVSCLAASLLQAEDARHILNQPGKVISQPSLKEALGPEWSVAKGEWKPADGVLTAAEIPDEHHAAVLHLATGPTPLIFECEFRFNGSKIFYIGCDGTKHVGRLVVMPKSAKLCEDSTEVKGKTPSDTLAESAVDLKPDDWQHLLVEYAGDRIIAHLNGLELQAQHPYLATPKTRWWFAVGGAGAQIRNVRISEGQPLADK